VNNKAEDNFKTTLKSLVNDEPQKLAFFDGLDLDSIPPFVPDEISKDNTKTTIDDNGADKRKKYSVRRRGNTFGMIATAACSVFLVCVAAINYGPDPVMNMSMAGGGGAPAPASVSEAPAAADVAETEESYGQEYDSGAPESAPVPETETYDSEAAEMQRPNAGRADDEATDNIAPAPLSVMTDNGYASEIPAVPLPLLIIGAIIFAAFFLILFKRRRYQ